FSDRSALRQQHVDLAQLRHDLFRSMLLLGHSNVLLRLNSLLQGGPLFRGQTTGTLLFEQDIIPPKVNATNIHLSIFILAGSEISASGIFVSLPINYHNDTAT